MPVCCDVRIRPAARTTLPDTQRMAAGFAQHIEEERALAEAVIKAAVGIVQCSKVLLKISERIALD